MADGRVAAVLLDWGNTLMRVFEGSRGAMADWPEVAVVPGVRRALRELQGHLTLGVATNAKDSDAADIRRALRRGRISSLLPRLYCFRSLGVPKSSPEFWAAVLADLGAPADRVVMVGDDPVADVDAAVRFGLRAVWFSERRGPGRFEPAVRTIRHMAELPGVLREAGWL